MTLPEDRPSADSSSSSPRPRRVGMISLGCPKNRVDGEIVLGELAGRGHELVADVGSAEAIVVNTCGFIEEAKEESIEAILEVVAAKEAAAERGEEAPRLLVAGCMVNRYGEELRASIPEIDGFVGLDDLRETPAILDGAAAGGRAEGSSGLVQLGGESLPKPSHQVFDHTAPRRLTTRGYGYLKVAEGCNNPCTFCAIPSWRGRFRSRTIESLLTEARRLEEEGVRELCLIAQDTTRYGEDLGLGKHGLTRLAEALLAGTTFPWIRFLYAYPTTLDAELLALMGSEERFCSYLDMPLQHSHPEILRAMRRGGRAERYLRLLDRARELVPDVWLRSTFIVGFPGETAEHFEHLVDFVRRARLDHLGVFAYSPEPGTPAAELSGKVPRSKAKQRLERLLEVQRPISLAARERLVGRRLRVLVEGTCEETEHLLQARHQGMAPEIDGRVLVNDGLAPAGTFAEVEVSAAYADDVVAHVVGPAGAPGVVPAESAFAAAGG